MTMCSAESTAPHDPNSGGGGGGGVIKTPDTTNRNPNRRSNKPIMEKRRRARINNCLNELKGILLEAMRKDPARHSKLEKADILELTVSHLKALHRHQGNGLDGTRFRAGFSECAAEVQRFLSSSTAVDGIDHQTSSRLLSHLADCMNNPSLTNGQAGQNPSTTSTTNPSHHLHLNHPHLNLSLNGHSTANNNSPNLNGSSNGNNSNSGSHTSLTSIDSHGNSTTTLNVPANTPIISLVPSRLASGEIAFVVPGFNSNARGASTPSSSIPIPIPLAAMQSIHCNPPPMLSPELPLELTVPSSSSSSSGCSLSPNYPVNHNLSQSHSQSQANGHGHHNHHHHVFNNGHHHFNGVHHSFSPTSISAQHSQPLALVTPKKEDRFQWRPWAL